MKITTKITSKRDNKSICLPFTEKDYTQKVKISYKFRKYIDNQIKLYPELFPPEITNGYTMKDIRFSKKLQISIRRIKVSGSSYTIRPSYIMPYMTGKTDKIEKAIFLRKFGVPFWAISYVFGKNAMNWYRKEKALGRNSIVGTTIKEPENIPKHIAADEKHSKLSGDKVYIATTVGSECILGTEISNNAWKFLFKSVVIICCFLHVFIKIRDRGKKKYKDLFTKVSSKLWESYCAENKRSFSQRIRRLLEWCIKTEVPDVFQKPIIQLRKNIFAYNISYDYPGAHRTSNMLVYQDLSKVSLNIV